MEAIRLMGSQMVQLSSLLAFQRPSLMAFLPNGVFFTLTPDTRNLLVLRSF